jgi:hypothetical protein
MRQLARIWSKSLAMKSRAMSKGTVYKDRKPALNAERIAQPGEQAAAGANRTKLAKEFGISRETLYQYIR